MIGRIMDWIRRKLDPPHYVEKLEEYDKTNTQKAIEVQRHRNNLERVMEEIQYQKSLEVLTGQRVEWPFVERRKAPRDKS